MIASDNGLTFRVSDYCRKVDNGGGRHDAHAHNTPNIVIVKQLLMFFNRICVPLLHRVAGIESEVFFCLTFG